MAQLMTALEISLLGIVVVFGALVLIGSVIGLVGRLGRERGTGDAVPEEVIAVISAAVATTLGPDVRVRRIRYAKPEEGAWSEQGRLIITASHQIK